MSKYDFHLRPLALGAEIIERRSGTDVMTYKSNVSIDIHHPEGIQMYNLFEIIFLVIVSVAYSNGISWEDL